MAGDLRELIEERVIADAPSGAEWPLYVLAACDGPNALDDVLGGEAPTRQRRPRSGTHDRGREHDIDAEPGEAAGTAEPLGAYLRSITVEGFRGIGPRRTLEIEPGPGLTLVVGRNGSGKSSFAEALELLLTGSNWRWAERARVWRDGWRNLHHRARTEIAAEFAVEGRRGAATVSRRWAADGDLTDGTVTVRMPGPDDSNITALTDLGTIGWTAALETYRPFLSYNELGSMLDVKPTDLHDRLAAILGLGILDTAAQVLRDARLRREKALDDARKRADPLIRRLDAVIVQAPADDRAGRARKAMAGRALDLDGLDRVLAGPAGGDVDRDDGSFAALRRLAGLAPPTVEAVLETAEALRHVAIRRDELAGSEAGEARATADLLRSALDFHTAHGDGACPVCERRSALSAAWHERAARKVVELDERAREAHEVETAARTTLARLTALLAAPPESLDTDGERAAIETGTLADSWLRFTSIPSTELGAMADHIERTVGPLAEAADAVRAEARAELDRRDSLWRPLALDLAGWLSEARRAAFDARPVADLRAAEKWLKGASADLRSRRFEPIATDAIELWGVLRQQSSIDLRRVTLAGTGPLRHVELEVDVDGVEGAALGVMSQGELHAIALSLFLPRATLAESPFRFVVIDDPVQSMDPARVDGLAQVLEQTGRSRQVVVFTHDDRLPEAMRRIGIDARIIEVSRREDSVIELRPSLDPVERNLADAASLVRTSELPALVAQQVVPGYCRNAIEAACIEVIRRRRIGRGEGHADVEKLIERNPKLTSRMALAMFDTAAKGGEVGAHVLRWGDQAVEAWGISNRGTHAGYRGSLDDLVRGTQLLCRKIRELA